MHIQNLRFGFLSIIFCGLAACQASANELPHAQLDRIKARIDALAQFGANRDGGIDRVAYSEADLKARAWVMEEMKKLELSNIRIDAGGNIIATRAGRNAQAKPIMFGSHIDSVLGGGNYDGQAGIVASLEAIDLLNAANVTTQSPLEVIVFSNEEGGLIGSLALTGQLAPDALDVVSDSGLTIRDGIKAIGGNPEALEDSVLEAGDLKAFLELHIEQGAILDNEDIDIGIVEGIVGIEWWDITLTGTANHAGTTPMDQRNDALIAASEMIIAVNETALSLEGRHVATVGRVQALPGAPNVIPGSVEFSLEIRDLVEEKIYEVYDAIEARLQNIAKTRNVELAIKRINVASHPALTDPKVRNKIVQAASDLDLSYKLMPSGAGHDAQDMVKVAPTAMIFVPSKDGVSHSPKEFTDAQDIANGSDVLARTILLLDDT